MIELVIAKPFAGAGMVATTLEVTPQKAQRINPVGLVRSKPGPEYASTFREINRYNID
ncbi:hypothetical protein ABIA26_000011 [Sinorhizobium fredii]